MKNFVIIIASIVLFSCSSKQAENSKLTEETAGKLKDEVFAIHDEVMPRSMKMEDMQEQIAAKFGKDTTLKTQGLALNSAMQSASDSMYVWMNALSGFEEMKPEERIKYLETQIIRGQAIKSATNKAIAEAETFLK